MVFLSFISTLVREQRESGVCSIVQSHMPIALSPMVFYFISDSFSRNVSLEYLAFYRDCVFIDRSSFRYDGPIPIRLCNTNSSTWWSILA